ncbi:MAG TPA: aminotransferase class V-fold PLP-dependent enzyme, partial [Ktedonobacteraceae bacterium]
MPDRQEFNSLAVFRDQFPLLHTHTYLASCSQAPLAIAVRTALDAFVRTWAEQGMDWDAWTAEVERAREAFATLIGASPTQVAIGTSVSQLVSSLASALVRDPRPAQRIISSEAEFPGVAHAWLAMRTAGWQVELLAADAQGTVGAAQFLTALQEPAAVVSVPHVCYINGALVPLSDLVASAHQQGTLVFVDAYQALGSVPIDVQASQVDFLASGALKYLCGTAGIAFLYVSPRVLEQLYPTVTGWFGRQNPFAFDPHLLDYAEHAARFDLGTPPVINAYTARAGIQLVQATGVEHIRAQILQIATLAGEYARDLGLTIAGPEKPQERGATTAVDVGTPQRAHWLEGVLRQHKCVVSARGQMIRLAPHGFTREEEMSQA